MLGILQVDKLLALGKRADAVNYFCLLSTWIHNHTLRESVSTHDASQRQRAQVCSSESSAQVMFTYSKRYQLTKEVKSIVTRYSGPSFIAVVPF